MKGRHENVKNMIVEKIIVKKFKAYEDKIRFIIGMIILYVCNCALPLVCTELLAVD